jgi:putative intracellular protease/amidase
MKILVCGGRNFDDRKMLHEVLGSMHSAMKVRHVIHSSADGAASMASAWSRLNGVMDTAYPAYEESAEGPIRNTKMLEDNPDIAYVVAFRGSNGTRNMVYQALAKGIPVWTPGWSYMRE